MCQSVSGGERIMMAIVNHNLLHKIVVKIGMIFVLVPTLWADWFSTKKKTLYEQTNWVDHRIDSLWKLNKINN